MFSGLKIQSMIAMLILECSDFSCPYKVLCSLEVEEEDVDDDDGSIVF